MTHDGWIFFNVVQSLSENPESNFTAYIFAPFHVTNQKNNYNVIFGRDLLQELGINLNFQNNFIGWKETKIHTKLINCIMRTNFATQERKIFKGATNRINQIFDAKYEKLNLKKIKINSNI